MAAFIRRIDVATANSQLTHGALFRFSQHNYVQEIDAPAVQEFH